MVNPLVISLKTVRFVGDVLDIRAKTIEELSFKQLPAESIKQTKNLVREILDTEKASVGFSSMVKTLWISDGSLAMKS